MNKELMIRALRMEIRMLTDAINDPRNLGIRKTDGNYVFHRCREYRKRRIERMQAEIEKLQSEVNENENEND